jgi:arylformamidase
VFDEVPEIIDISQPIGSKTASIKGGAGFSRKLQAALSKGNAFNMSDITLGVRVGTHAVSPACLEKDMDKSTETIGAMPLEPFVGYALVVDLSPMEKGEITAAMIINACKSFEDRLKDAEEYSNVRASYPRRCLVKTQEKIDSESLRNEYPYFGLDAVDYLHSRGIDLIGIDTPSVGKLNADDPKVQSLLVENGMCWLENLDLTALGAGVYMLVAAPLKLMEVEASPVRAFVLNIPR